MSGIRYTPPGGGSGVIPDLQQVLDAGNSATGQTITLIDGGPGTDDCVWTPRGMTAVSGIYEKLVILAASTTTTPDEEGVIRMYGAASSDEQITIETTPSDGGSITVAVDQFTKLRIFNNRIEYHKIESFLPAVATLLFPATITNGDIYQIQTTPGTFAWLSDLPQDTSSTSITASTDYTIFGTGGTNASVRKVGKLVTLNIGFTRIASAEFRICLLPTGYRPTLRWKGIISNSGGDALDIEVATNGFILIDSALPAGVIGTTWLCLISFYTT
jgi:hypothetical protein